MTVQVPDNYKLFKREFDVSPVEFYRIQLSLIIPNMNNTKLSILAYIAHYGYKEARKKIIQDGIVTSVYSLHNFISEMRLKEIVVGYKNNVRLHEDIFLCRENHVTIFQLTKNESKDEVGHKHFRTQLQ